MHASFAVRLPRTALVLFLGLFVTIPRAHANLLQSALDRDLGSLDDSYYLPLDPTKSIEENTAHAFDHFVLDMGLSKEFEGEELEAYKGRVKEAVVEHDHSEHIFSLPAEAQGHAYTTDFKTAIEEQKPVVLKREIDLINASPLGWRAHRPEWMLNISVHDLKMLNGLVMDKEGGGKLEVAYKGGPEMPVYGEELLQAKNYSLGIPDNFTDTYAWRPWWHEQKKDRQYAAQFHFDSREKWPECREVLSHVRDQGKCGSCWAHAAAGAIEGQICVRNGAKWSGPSAWISAGYLASCANGGQDGCTGGNPADAIEYAMKGIPTGGHGDNQQTCVPYFGEGDALEHFNGGGSSPPCPRSCTGTQYPRSLQEDKWKTGGVSDTASVSEMRSHLQTEGALAIGFAVYRDFMSYSGGVYRPATRKKNGMHATTAIGYGSNYVLAVNSWGTRWGDKGLFKLSTECCSITYFLPTPYPFQQPFPLPNALVAAKPEGYPLFGAKFIRNATESQVTRCMGGNMLLLLNVRGRSAGQSAGSGMMSATAARRRRRRVPRTGRRRRSVRRRRKKNAAPSPPTKKLSTSRCVLYFGHKGCPECKEMEPGLDEAAEKANATILAVPFSMWGQFSFCSQPYFYGYSNGKSCGNTTKAQMSSSLNNCGGLPPPPSPTHLGGTRSGECDSCRVGCIAKGKCSGPSAGFCGDHSDSCERMGGTWCGPRTGAPFSKQKPGQCPSR